MLVAQPLIIEIDSSKRLMEEGSSFRHIDYIDLFIGLRDPKSCE
jgi:hypothetical protein